MPHPRTVPALMATPEDRAELKAHARSCAAPARRVARAQILSAYLEGASIPKFAC